MQPSSQAYGALQEYSKNRKSSQQIQQEADQKYDVSGLTSRLSNQRVLVGNLENSLENVDPSVRSRSAGGFVTEGQNQALINREQQPILGSLSKAQGSLSTTQQDLNSASSLSQQLAQSLRSDDETGYQRLLDQYNVAVAQEAAAEDKRRYEESVKLDREKQAAAVKATGGYDLSSILSAVGGGQSPSASVPAQDPETQRAYSAVKDLLGTNNGALIQKTYTAIKDSANRGNAYDKKKLALIEQLYPAVKNYGKNTVSLSAAIPTAVPLGGDSGGGLGVGVANPGRLRF